eukprot:1138838-Pelagomonas_calceolata.AAC.2
MKHRQGGMRQSASCIVLVSSKIPSGCGTRPQNFTSLDVLGSTGSTSMILRYWMHSHVKMLPPLAFKV